MSSTSESEHYNNDEYQFDDIQEEQVNIRDEVKEVKKSQKKQTQQKKQSKKDNKEKKTNKDNKEKKTRVIKQEFSKKLLIHNLNSFYDNFKFKDADTIKDNKESGKSIVYLKNYSALDEFRNIMEQQEEDENRKGEKMKEKEKWDYITHSIWNFKLRGILTAINDFEIMKKKEDDNIDSTLLTDHILPQLHFDTIDKFDSKDIIGNIAEFFTSDKFKFKLFNAIFPHPAIKGKDSDNEKGEHLKKVYLQNISNYHDEYLKMLYNGKKTTADKLFKYACDQIADSIASESITSDKLFNADFKKLKDSFTSEEIKEYGERIKLAKYEKATAERYYKCYSLAIEQELTTEKKAKETYNNYKDIIKRFNDMSKDIMKADVRTKEKFVNKFVECFNEVNKYINYKSSIKTFIKDINCSKKLVFTQKFKQVLTKLITKDPTLTVKYSGETFNADYTKADNNDAHISGDIIQEERHPTKSLYDSLSKIGLIANNKVRKDIRVGIAIGLIDYIITEANAMNTKVKKAKTLKQQKKIIYIK